MRFCIYSIIIFFININVYGQTRTITGRIIDEDFETIPEARIQNSDTVLLCKTDINGNFKIEIPIETKKILISWIAMEWKTIYLHDNCDHLDIILMYDAHYDFMSSRKVDRLRKKRFNKLPEIHKVAFEKGIFLTEKPCYRFEFVSIKGDLDKIEKNRHENKKPST